MTATKNITQATINVDTPDPISNVSSATDDKDVAAKKARYAKLRAKKIKPTADLDSLPDGENAASEATSLKGKKAATAPTHVKRVQIDYETDKRFRKPADSSLHELWADVEQLTVDALKDELIDGLSAVEGSVNISECGVWADRDHAVDYWQNLQAVLDEFIAKTGRTDLLVWGEHRSGLVTNKIEIERETDEDGKLGKPLGYLQDPDDSLNESSEGFSGQQLQRLIAVPVAGHKVTSKYEDGNRLEGTEHYQYSGPVQYLAGRDYQAKFTKRLPGFYAAVGTIEDLLTHHTSGYPWCPAIRHPHDGRHAIATLGTWIVALDIDSGLPVKVALKMPVFQRYGCAIAETATSTTTHPKYRVFFRMPSTTPLTGDEAVSNVTALLMSQWSKDAKKIGHQYGKADSACSDSSRYFFGAIGGKVHGIDTKETLPKGILSIAKKLAEKQLVIREKKAAKNLESVQLESANNQYTLEMVREALNHLKPRQKGMQPAQYPILVHLFKGLVNVFGPELTRNILETSPLASNVAEDWDTRRVIEWATKYHNSGDAGGTGKAGIGLVFAICKGQEINLKAGTQETKHLLQEKKGPWLSDAEIRTRHSELEASLNDDQSSEQATEALKHLKEFEDRYRSILYPHSAPKT